MKRSIPRSLLAALALGSATLCYAQTVPDVGPTGTPGGATHDCTGMTGTAQTESEEFHKTYNLEVVPIPFFKGAFIALAGSECTPEQSVNDEIRIASDRTRKMRVGV